MMWHQNGLPSFMTPGELKAAGFDIDASHHPFWTAFDVKETLSDYYDRCHMVTSSILEKHKNDGMGTVSEIFYLKSSYCKLFANQSVCFSISNCHQDISSTDAVCVA